MGVTLYVNKETKKGIQASDVTGDLTKVGISSIDFIFSTADEKQAKSSSSIIGLKMTGGINYNLEDPSSDPVGPLAIWASKHASSKETYRPARVEIVASGQTIRSYLFPYSFVAEYTEAIAEDTGGGKFSLTLYEKGDSKDDVVVAGSYEFKES